MPVVKKSLLVLLVIGLIAAGCTYYGLSGKEEPETLPPVTAENRKEASKRTEIAVYVTGAVVEPGVVYLQQGARGGDAVKACGGFLPEAAVDQVNLAMVLKDGQQLRVPVKPAPGTGAVGTANPDGSPGGSIRNDVNCVIVKSGNVRRRTRQYQHRRCKTIGYASGGRSFDGTADHRIPRGKWRLFDAGRLEESPRHR